MARWSRANQKLSLAPVMRAYFARLRILWDGDWQLRVTPLPEQMLRRVRIDRRPILRGCPSVQMKLQRVLDKTSTESSSSSGDLLKVPTNQAPNRHSGFWWPGERDAQPPRMRMDFQRSFGPRVTAKNRPRDSPSLGRVRCMLRRSTFRPLPFTSAGQARED
jgi:hypothetical protein